MKNFEIIFVVSLFCLYLLLWKIKEINQKIVSGINPKVMAKSTSNIQKYMNKFMGFLILYAVAVVILHSIGLQYSSLFSRYELLNNLSIDILGFIVGLIGLSFCLYAQVKMGKSWRVGIDETVETELVTNGLYKFIRNPTYLGLFILSIGFWLIWPTWTVFIFNLMFILFFEIQVCCEEDFLTLKHGEKYLNYKSKTKRYIPFIY